MFLSTIDLARRAVVIACVAGAVATGAATPAAAAQKRSAQDLAEFKAIGALLVADQGSAAGLERWKALVKRLAKKESDVAPLVADFKKAVKDDATQRVQKVAAKLETLRKTRALREKELARASDTAAGSSNVLAKPFVPDPALVPAPSSDGAASPEAMAAQAAAGGTSSETAPSGATNAAAMEAAAAETAAAGATSAETAPTPITTKAELEAYIGALESHLAATGAEEQLAQTEQQTTLQKQQQTVVALSSISKMLHDTAMSIIRKIG